MDAKVQTPNLNEPPVKKEAPPPQVQNENIEPKRDVASNAKSFFNNKEVNSNPPQKINKPPLSNNVPASNTASNTQSNSFNGNKITGISSLNPYQNK